MNLLLDASRDSAPSETLSLEGRPEDDTDEAPGAPVWSMQELVDEVTASAMKRFHRYITYDDLQQELWTYIYGTGRGALGRFAKADETSRIKAALAGAARQYYEVEKAAQTGYGWADIAWYSPASLADLVPLALDPEWDTITGAIDNNGLNRVSDPAEGNTMLAMVCDIRRVLGSRTGWPVSEFDPETEDGYQRLATLADQLGGQFPNSPGYQRGRRQIVSNAQARAVIGETE